LAPTVSKNRFITNKKEKKKKKSQHWVASQVGLQKGFRRLTRNNIAGIHGILVFDEAKAIHHLHLCNFSGAMGRKVSFDIGLGSCSEKKRASVEKRPEV
jgi:hypothetical protein